ncbi:MAG: carboxypeptidase regulatory-like domain-containing protein, partial [Candidatus Acidiferrales bacterium]
MRKLSFFYVVLCVVVFLVSLASVPVSLAQTSKGTVTGTVTDPSGAVIPNAAVTLTQKETNAKRDTTTNGAGIYRFEAVNLGTYTLNVKAPGFSDAEVAGIVVSNQPANFDVQLKLGTGSQTVSVEAGAEVLQTTDAVHGGTFESRDVTQLPLQGQDSINLMLLLPGVQNASTTQFSDGSNNYSVNGQRARANNFMIDGVENNDISIAGAAFQITNNDAIQEVSIQTSNFSAEYGRAGGAVVNQITRSGTNSFHGTAAEVYKSNVFNATSNSDRLASATSPAKFNENIPAFTVGGPVYIPHLYDGRNKTFFFGAAQWDRFFSTATRVVTAPIAGATGIGVLQTLAPNCPNVALYLQALGSFVGSGITPQTISIAAPGGPTCDGTLRTGKGVDFSNATRVASQSNLDANHLVRIDQIVSSKQTMSFRWLYDSNTSGPFFNNLPGFDRGFNGKTMTGLFTDTYVFGPRWTNEFR